ncbi:uncharacterized protein Z518_00694 [Rhinocladiella mackenziei CBS 650.93]|uniref:Uncharacterized protein n=1 Tax=Rhinocladiella mackenziei CBS 650.93 TaxID=1442369 RepID=A0A0D2IU76_9EURO|nr:uncharacterized protein Z518_00694 [Rhinocladiella mackenziei CBS 650.93]KIX09614.1 hypothetical protein Z518_00694 [Rhinocladiella mackenziei CBS 650.93]
MSSATSSIQVRPTNSYSGTKSWSESAWLDWSVTRSTSTSSSVGAEATTSSLTTATTSSVVGYPTIPSHTASNSSWTENGCDAIPPYQLVKNPSFECSDQGWTLDEADIVWGGVLASKRDLSSPDVAYDGKGFARLHPASGSETATLSQTLDTPAPNGSYWYSFAYRVPESGVTPDGCTLTVSTDEGSLATIGSLSTASSWMMTGKEFTIEASISVFSLAFSCNGADTTSPVLDLDYVKMGLSSGSGTSGHDTTGNSTGPPAHPTSPPVDVTSPDSSVPPANVTSLYDGAATHSEASGPTSTIATSSDPTGPTESGNSTTGVSRLKPRGYHRYHRNHNVN